MGKASKLVKDLSQIPNIIGGLGLSIAAAQKAFNLDYMDNIERILTVSKVLLESKGEDGKELEGDAKARHEAAAGLFKELITALAPARYHFSETTLKVRMDLAQSKDLAGSIGLGVGYGGVTVNGSVALGYAQDYRAAAEVTTVLKAITADQKLAGSLAANANGTPARTLLLPEQAEVDDAILDSARNTFEKLVGAKPQAPYRVVWTGKTASSSSGTKVNVAEPSPADGEIPETIMLRVGKKTPISATFTAKPENAAAYFTLSTALPDSYKPKAGVVLEVLAPSE